MVACEAYDVEQLEKDSRVVMHFKPELAPYKAAILPLSKQLGEQAKEVLNMLNKHFSVVYDETGSIGKRYRRSDAIGTPYTITVDDETINNNVVTIRNRDTMEQTTIKVNEIKYLICIYV